MPNSPEPAAGRAGEAAGRLVVVLCPERSGSTLLAATLGSHSHVLAPPELHLLRYPDFDVWRAAYPQAMASLKWLLERLALPADDAAIERAFSGRETTELCRALLQRCGPGRLLVDKTPAYARSDATLARFATLKPSYVWLLRHPLGVAASMLEREEKTHPTGRAGRSTPWWLRHFKADPEQRRLRKKLRYWREAHARIARFLARVPPEDVVKIHYEQLVREPEKQVARLARALGLTLEPAMMAPWRSVPDVLAWGIGDEKAGSYTSFEASRADAWRARFAETDLDRRTRRLMAHLGVTA
jgi:hypothetical protein